MTALHMFRRIIANFLTKLVNRKRRRLTPDAGGRREIKDSEIVADVNFTGVTDHPETPLSIKVTVT